MEDIHEILCCEQLAERPVVLKSAKDILKATALMSEHLGLTADAVTKGSAKSETTVTLRACTRLIDTLPEGEGLVAVLDQVGSGLTASMGSIFGLLAKCLLVAHTDAPCEADHLEDLIQVCSRLVRIVRKMEEVQMCGPGPRLHCLNCSPSFLHQSRVFRLPKDTLSSVWRTARR